MNGFRAGGFGGRPTVFLAALAVAAGIEAGSAQPAGSAPGAGATAGAIECRIAVDKTNGFLRLRAIARAPAAATGHYRFSVTKNNAAGSTANAQSGDFALAPGEDRVLTTVMLEAAAEGHFSATLSLASGAGSAECHSP